MTCNFPNSLLFLLLRILTAVANRECAPKRATLYYVNNDDSIYQRHLNESMADELLHSSTNRKHNTIKTLTHTQTPQHNYIDFVKTESPHKIHKLNCDSGGHEHAIDTRKVIRELAHDSVTGHYYAITDDDTIDIRTNEFHTLVTKSYTSNWANQLASLQLNPTKGQMFWIWQKSQSVVKMAGMDGGKVRDIYTGSWIYSISLDAEENLLYIAELDYITKLNLTSLQVYKFLDVRAEKIHYFNCEFFYVNREDRELRQYTTKGEHIKINRINGALLPFHVGLNDHTRYKNPCSNFTCEHFCILGEGSKGAIPVCFCPHCEQSLLENHWFLAFSISLGTLLFMLFAFCCEMRFNWAARLCDINASTFGSEIITEPSVRYRNSNASVNDE